MSTPNNFWRKLGVNSSKPNLSVVSIPLLAIAATLSGLQPLSAEEKNNDLVIAKDSNNIPEQIFVKSFNVVGSSIFSKQELNRAVKS